MTQCPICNSKSVSTRSVRKNLSGVVSQRYQCNSCNKWFSLKIEPEMTSETLQTDIAGGITRYVITSCQNNAAVHEEFCKSLANYCKLNNAQLLIVPIQYRVDDHDMLIYDIPAGLPHELVSHKKRIHPEVFVMGSFNFIPTSVNPLQGLESLSKGDTLIVPSPQLRMKSLAVSASRHPAILHTTGAISRPEYTNTKMGEKALFNHSYSAVVVEIDKDNDFHIRVLNADEDTGKFIDLGVEYSPDTEETTWVSPIVIVTGDEHAIVSDPVVKEVTYINFDSIVKTLKPKYVVRHDVLDCESISHHNRKNVIKNIGKTIFGTNSIEKELQKTVDYIEETTIGECENIFVSSNHNDHLLRWMSEVDIREEPHNALFYHTYMAKIIKSMTKTPTGVSHINPFAEYCKDWGLKQVRFLSRDESFRVADVELGHHGDKGTNGSRGSINQYANLCDKTVIGHSHSPGIVFGAYQVGTSSMLKLDYTSGISSWLHTHCLVFPSGKRQLVNIINGKWRA